VIHANKSQSARQIALARFKAGKSRVLVATDIVARGIDIIELSHVINFDLPESPEDYVHRIGRTGRAGLSGTAISFCDPLELKYLRSIEKLTGIKVPVVEEHPYPADMTAPAPSATAAPPRRNAPTHAKYAPAREKTPPRKPYAGRHPERRDNRTPRPSRNQ
jgi:ATP-dependent RNA helicase RhlE